MASYEEAYANARQGMSPQKYAGDVRPMDVYPDAPVPAPGINSSLARLNGALDRAESRVATLRESLLPVLRPFPSAEEEMGMADTTPGSIVKSAIDDATARADRVAAYLLEIERSLDT